MTAELTSQELADILRVTMRIGVLMLRCGSVSFRVREAMDRAALALGADRLEAYVTPTAVIASVYSGREHRTQIVHISGIAVDMNLLCKVELFTRHLSKGTKPETLNAQLDAAEKLPKEYSRFVVILMVALACGAFALLLGGGAVEFAAAVLGAGFAQTIRMQLNKNRINPILITMVCSAIATAISYFLIELARQGNIPLTNPRTGVVASVLLMVPGVPLVTAMLDLTRFDLVSGTTRGVYAFILLVSIAIGMLLILVWTGFQII